MKKITHYFIFENNEKVRKELTSPIYLGLHIEVITKNIPNFITLDFSN